MPIKRFICIVFIWGNVYAQTNNTYINFIPVFNGHLITAEQQFQFSGYHVQFQTIKFYISGVSLLKDGKITWAEENSYHLMDLFDVKRSGISIPVVDYDKIHFCLGLDSITNTSGALGGDLDPTIGMYWAWQSGYINAKIEGKHKNKEDDIKSFSYHLGGYLFPFSTIRSLELKATSVIYIDLSGFLKSIDFYAHKDIMSPGADAVKLSSELSKCFKAEK